MRADLKQHGGSSYALPLAGRALLGAIFAIAGLARTRAEEAGLRVATFNVSLYGERAGEVLARVQQGDDPQARCVAEIIQHVRPEILLLNEIDYHPDGDLVRVFCEKYLAVGQNASGSPDGPAEPIAYPHRYFAPVNTGRHSGFDLDRNGAIDADPASADYSGDCWGYGRYEGQYALAVLSQHPIDAEAARTFRAFRWKDMPGARLPDDAATPAPGDYYSAKAVAEFPLSSKNHCDIPIDVRGRRIHLLVSHPTPPVFDGEENRNGHRNHDEIRFWADYVGPPEGAAYIYDDNSEPGGLSAGEPFIILGDLNGDPHDGDGSEGIAKLLAAPRVLKYPPPESAGAEEQSRLQAGANLTQQGPPENDTCDPADDPGPGNLRIDYVLPSADLKVQASGVFWPAAADPLFPLVGVHPFPSSDHRLVWVDLEL